MIIKYKIEVKLLQNIEKIKKIENSKNAKILKLISKFPSNSTIHINSDTTKTPTIIMIITIYLTKKYMLRIIRTKLYF